MLPRFPPRENSAKRNGANNRAVPQWQKVERIIASIPTCQRPVLLLMTGLWRESHSPEIIQRLQRFDAAFPELAFPVVLYPRDVKLSGLLRKTVGEFHFSSDLQLPGCPDHRAQHPDYAGMRGFVQRIPIRRRAPHFHGDPHDNARALPLFFKLRCVDQPYLPTRVQTKWVIHYDVGPGLSTLN